MVPIGPPPVRPAPLTRPVSAALTGLGLAPAQNPYLAPLSVSLAGGAVSVMGLL
jgi:hypothetical protein